MANGRITYTSLGEKKKLFWATALFLLILIMPLLLPLCSANLGTFKQNQCMNIRVLANCSNINLVEVTNQNETYNISKSMTKISGQTFSYQFCDTTNLGIYSYSWDNPCVDCSTQDCGNSFLVTVTGQEMTTSKAISYTLIFVISFLIFIGLIIIGLSVKYDNKRDEMTGYIIALSNLKYVKLFCLSFSYIVALFISYFSWMVCYAYLDMNFLSSIFQFIFYFLAASTLPLFILVVYITIANLIRDSKISETLTRGLEWRD